MDTHSLGARCGAVGLGTPHIHLMNTNTDKQTDSGKAPRVKRPAIGKEKLILHTDGNHYWLQHDGSMRKTDWILRDGFAVLTAKL